MKITLGEIRDMAPGLNAILSVKLPAKPSYWLGRFLDRASSEMKSVEKARHQLIQKYVIKDKDDKLVFKKDEEGKPTKNYDFTDENWIKYQEELDDLLATEITVDIKPIKLDDLDVEVCEKCGRKKLYIEPGILAQLGKIIVA